MSERQTGATPEQIEAAAKRHYDSFPRQLKWVERTPEYRTQWMRQHILHARNLVPPTQRIVEADDLRAVLRLAEVHRLKRLYDEISNDKTRDDKAALLEMARIDARLVAARSAIQDGDDAAAARLREVLGDA